MPTKESILKRYFGYERFLPLQAEIIEHILAKKDALVLMPTGGGKSLCFQIPALLFDGITLVISPLIALMKDQVEALKANGIKADFMNSSLSEREIEKIATDCLQGKIKLLYVSPEKIFSSGFLDFIQRLPVSLIAIDEAHCISFWGHDFRPEYAKLKILKQKFPDIPVITLTATADKVTRKDILTQMGIPNAQIFISSFDRPNLSLTVKPGQKRIEQIFDFLRKHQNQSGIIYCLSRRTTETIAEKLQEKGFKAKHYHAGMDPAYRSKTQDEFIRDDIQIICATIAFGMGIDKSNIRWVIHYNLPKNIENFYQEIGRAGRDRIKSDTMLFYSYADVISQSEMLNELSAERKELMSAKLERMRQYAESDICRRKILLSYFNEALEKDCGNCDVCLSPRQKFDATVIAQKALSAITRTNEQIAMTTLVDILRGAQTKVIQDKGYDKIKTFGVGHDLKTDEWFDYIFQMLNSGWIDIAYDEGHTFKLNERSREVLKGEKQVMLVRFTPIKNRVEKEKVVTKTKKEVLADSLFERLRTLRKKLADEQGVPAYVIFSDKSLDAMAQERPMDQESMLAIPGVGVFKYQQYGQIFINEIMEFVKEESNAGIKIKGSTYIFTYDLYRQGLSIDQIANQRNLNPTTILTHLAYLYEKGHDVDLSAYIDDQELSEITNAIENTVSDGKDVAKPIFDYLNGKYDYSKIRIAVALYRKS